MDKKMLSGVTGFLGLPGCGKTYRMTMKFWDKSRRVVCFNFASGWGPPGECKANQNPLPGFTFVYSPSDLSAVLRQTGEKAVRVCFTAIRSGFEKKEVFNDVSKLVCDFSRDYGATCYAVDEIWNGQESGWSPEYVNECFTQWRHYDLSFLWSAQQPQQTDQGMRAMCNEVYVGRLFHRLDIKAVQDCGLSEEATALLPNLPNRQFVHRLEDRSWRVEK